MLELLTALDREFARRGMTAHLKAAREQYRLARLGQASWDETFVLDWLGALRVPPYQDRFRVRPAGDGCPDCGSKGDRRTARSLPDGALLQCACGARWLAV